MPRHTHFANSSASKRGSRFLVCRTPFFQRNERRSSNGDPERFARVNQFRFPEWEKLPRIPSDWKIVGVLDELQDRYTLQQVSSSHHRYDTRLLAYLEIRDGKIWILTYNTEEGLASKRVAQGVAKNTIVLGFYSPNLREAGEFAVA